MAKIITRKLNGSISYSVQCQNGERHKVRISPDGELLDYAHDLEGEEVIRALGGALPECAIARTIFATAADYLDVYTGQRDCNGLVSLHHDEWRDDSGSCSTCAPRPALGLTHFNSIQHHAGRVGIQAYMSQLKSTLEWLRENKNGEPGTINNLRDMEFALDRSLVCNQSSWIDNWIVNSAVTTGFARIASKVTLSEQIDDILFLRSRFTAQWLQSFYNALSQKAKNKVRGDFAVWKKIEKARNRDPQKVAGYVNAGIYSHIYTYINNHVSPEQAREIYDGYEGMRSAKSFLDGQIPVARAIRELRNA